MNAEGRLLSRQQLEECYATFRSHFGRERLANHVYIITLEGAGEQ
jgi:hypothetical protein